MTTHKFHAFVFVTILPHFVITLIIIKKNNNSSNIYNIVSTNYGPNTVVNIYLILMRNRKRLKYNKEHFSILLN